MSASVVTGAIMHLLRPNGYHTTDVWQLYAGDSRKIRFENLHLTAEQKAPKLAQIKVVQMKRKTYTETLYVT